jgi:flagellin
MRINTNVSALNTQRLLGQTNSAVARSIGRLSSGFRINRAADDAAGLAIANRLRADQRSLGQAARNAEQANTMLQVMEGATTQIQGIIERMKELATQANSGTSGADGGAAKLQLQSEFNTLRTELNRIVDTTTFNGQKLLAGGFGTTVQAGSTILSGDNGIFDATLNGTAAGEYTLADNADGTFTLTRTADLAAQTVSQADGRGTMSFSEFGISFELDDQFAALGAAADIGTVDVVAGGAGAFMVSSSGAYAGDDLVSVGAVDLRSSALGVDGDSVSTAAGAQTALANLDTAITTLGTAVGSIGVAQNRLDYAFQNVKASIENIAAAESTIRDADMAAEMSEFSRNQILQQAGTAMLAQANQAPQSVLQLLR